MPPRLRTSMGAECFPRETMKWRSFSVAFGSASTCLDSSVFRTFMGRTVPQLGDMRVVSHRPVGARLNCPPPQHRDEVTRGMDPLPASDSDLIGNRTPATIRPVP